MERKAVESSNLAEIGYDAGTQTLEVLFKNGNIYQFFDVPGNVHEELMNPPTGSHGTYFTQTVKGTYRFAKL